MSTSKAALETNWDSSIASLMNMGFEYNKIITALTIAPNHDLSTALNYLLQV